MLSDPSGPALWLRDAVIARYDEVDVAQGEKLPARQMLAHGQPTQIAADEDDSLDPHGSLTVSLAGLNTTVGTGESTQRTPVSQFVVTTSASYVLRLLRPYPRIDANGVIPPPAQITAAAEVLIRDSARLVDALHAWTEALPVELRVRIGQVDPVGPFGGLSGCRVTADLWPL